MTLVRKLVELHGGSVEARSEGTGKGSEFVVTLPVAPAEKTERRAVAERSAETKPPSRRILVVDDNPATAESLTILLTMWGHRVESAASGAEALALAPVFDPQIVLLDIGLPGMEGYEVARRMREDLHLDPVIVAMTGYGREEDRRRSREAGLRAHMVKPVEPDTLQKLLAEIG